MKIFKLMALVAVLAGLTACNNGGGTSISGKATGVESMLLLQVVKNSTDTIGDIAVENGEFNYDLQIDSVQLYFLQAGGLTVPLFVQPGEEVELTISADAEKPNYVVSGSPESERVKEITNILDSAVARIDRINAEASQLQAGEGSSAQKAALDSSFQAVISQTTEDYEAFIEQQPGSLANIFVLSQRIGNIPLYDVQKNFPQVERIAAGLEESYPGHTITVDFNNKVNQMKPQMERAKKMEATAESIVEGKPAPEIALTDPEGNVRKLSDLRGQVVLVDFWAAWCRPCRMENPNLVNTYEEFKDKGFTVYSVSLDGLPNQQNPKEAWTQAISDDNLSWDSHVSDLKGWQSSVIDDYGFQGIPYTVLVDREGNILATNLRGPALREKLAEVMSSES